MNRIAIFALVAFVAVTIQVFAAPSGYTPVPVELKPILAFFEINSVVDTSAKEELAAIWTPEHIESIRNVFADQKYAAQIQILPRLHSLSEALKQNPTNDLESTLESYKEARHQLLEGVDNFVSIKQTPTGETIDFLLCPEHSNQTLSDEKVGRAAVEVMERMQLPRKHLSDVEQDVAFFGSPEVKAFAGNAILSTFYSVPVTQIAAAMRTELAQINKLNC